MSWSSTNLTSTPPCDAAALTPKELAKASESAILLPSAASKWAGDAAVERLSTSWPHGEESSQGLRWKIGCLFRPAEGGQGGVLLPGSAGFKGSGARGVGVAIWTCLLRITSAGVGNGGREANEVPRGTLPWQSGGQDGTDAGRRQHGQLRALPNPDEQLLSPKRHVSRAAILTHQEGRKTSQDGRQAPLPVVAMPQPHRAQRQGVSPTPDCVLCAWLAAVTQLAIDLAHAPQARGGQRNRYTWSRID